MSNKGSLMCETIEPGPENQIHRILYSYFKTNFTTSSTIVLFDYSQ